MSGIVMHVRRWKRTSGALSGSAHKKNLSKLKYLQRSVRQTTANRKWNYKMKEGKKCPQKNHDSAMFGFVSSFFRINGFFDPTRARAKKHTHTSCVTQLHRKLIRVCLCLSGEWDRCSVVPFSLLLSINISFPIFHIDHVFFLQYLDKKYFPHLQNAGKSMEWIMDERHAACSIIVRRRRWQFYLLQTSFFRAQRR